MSRVYTLVFAVVLLVTAPVHAADVVEDIPEPNWPASGRILYVSTLNDEPLRVGRIEFVAGATPQDVRYHEVAQDVDGTRVEEVIVVGGRSYLRVNSETRWTSRPYNPPEDFYPHGDPLALFGPRKGATLLRVGDASIDGIATTQYQFQVAPANVPGDLRSVKLDLFIGKADGYLYQEQLTFRTVLAKGEPEVELGFVLRLRDVDAAVIIGAPPDNLIDRTSLKTRDRVLAFNPLAELRHVR